MDELTTAAGSDRDLARAAQGGDAAALGLLFERHRTRLYAHALQHLGHGPDAQDAVQDTFVIAIRRIGALRDPDAVAGWLHTVLRSVCFSRLRGTRDVPVAALPDEPGPGDETPEAAIEALAMRDWVWTAIGRLSEPLRVVTMLRHFSRTSSYDEIAAICGVPVGTVRSRLNEGRRRLGDEMLRTARAAHGDAAAYEETERRRFLDGIEHFDRTMSHERYLEGIAEDIEVQSSRGFSFRGREVFQECILEDAEAGIGFAPERILAGPGITIVEARFVNPPHDPFHCPPATTQVHFRANGLTHRQVWYLAPRPEGEGEAAA
jgi:RNA polymerase sigma-70 factor (ECF subfamily)